MHDANFTPMTHTQHLIIARRHINLHASTQHALECLVARFDACVLMDVLSDAAPASSITLDFSLPATATIPVKKECLFEEAGRAVFASQSGYVLTWADTFVHLEPAHARASGFIAPHFWQEPLHMQRSFLMMLLMLMMRHKHAFALHANALVTHNNAVLFIGASGSGKTTTALSLVRCGWHYLGDDTIILEAQQQQIEALAIRKGFAVRPATHQHFKQFVSSAQIVTGHKQTVTIPDGFGGQLVKHAVPRVLIFPTLSSQATSLTPLAPTQALLRLSKQSLGMGDNKTVSHQQLELLSRLVRQCQAFTLALGVDALHAPEALSAQLKQVLATSVVNAPQA